MGVPGDTIAWTASRRRGGTIMLAKWVRGALPAAVCAGCLQPAMVWASDELPLMTADDNFGLLALVSGLLAFWMYFRAGGEDQV